MTTYLYSFRSHLTLFFGYLFLTLSCSPNAFAQEGTYQLRGGLDIPLLAGGAAGVTASILLRDRREPLSLEDVDKLSVDDILAFDGGGTNYSEGAAITSDVLVASSFASPLALLAFDETRGDASTLGLIYLETIMINEALTGITKALVKRPRPFAYNRNAPEAVRTNRTNNLSFFSGHTSHSAATSFFTAKTISDYVDRSGVRAVAWTSAILLPAATGFFRYKAGKHFPSDVVVGYLVGASVGVLVPHLHKTDPEEGGNNANSGSFPLVQEIFSVTLVF